jgi:hypothetical protein
MRPALFILLAVLCVGCHRVRLPSEQTENRYTLTAYTAGGVCLGQETFGENLRGGRLVVTDSLTGCRLTFDPNMGLDYINFRSNRYLNK